MLELLKDKIPNMNKGTIVKCTQGEYEFIGISENIALFRLLNEENKSTIVYVTL